MEVPNTPLPVDDANRADRRQKWYAIAEPIRGVYDSYERCQQELKGINGARRGPVEVSSEEEGWAVLSGGIRLTPGLYAFTDATAVGGVGVVMVRMPEGESSEPVILEPKCSSSFSEPRSPVLTISRSSTHFVDCATFWRRWSVYTNR
jgi:hypothetical protein